MGKQQTSQSYHRPVPFTPLHIQKENALEQAEQDARDPKIQLQEELTREMLNIRQYPDAMKLLDIMNKYKLTRDEQLALFSKGLYDTKNTPIDPSDVEAINKLYIPDKLPSDMTNPEERAKFGWSNELYKTANNERENVSRAKKIRDIQTRLWQMEGSPDAKTLPPPEPQGNNILPKPQENNDILRPGQSKVLKNGEVLTNPILSDNSISNKILSQPKDIDISPKKIIDNVEKKKTNLLQRYLQA